MLLILCKGDYSFMQENIGHLIKLVGEQLQKKGDEALRESGLTSTQMYAMWYIHSRGGAATQKDIERFLRVSRPTVTGILSRMEKKGFLVTEINPQDRRSRIIHTTEKADHFRDMSIKHHAQSEKIIRRGLSEEEVGQLRRLLTKVYDNLTEYEHKEAL